MTTPELAKVCMTLAHQLGLSSDNREDFALEIMKLSLFGDSTLETAPRPAPERAVATEREGTAVETREKQRKRVTQEKRKEKRSEATPPPAVPKKLLCKAGQKCHCDICKKPVYTLINDLYDGMKAVDFAAKFMPIGHGKLMPTDFRIRAVDGCVMTDCPVCGGDMSLVLWGKKPENDFADGDAGSVGGI